MEILAFVKGLLPSLNTEDLSDDINNAIAIIDTATMPMLNKVTNQLKGVNAFSEGNKSIITFQQRVKMTTTNSPRDTNILEDCEVSLRHYRKWLDWARKAVDGIKTQQVVATGISYNRANVVRVLALTQFMTRYISQVTIWVLREENAVRSGNMAAAGATMLKPEFNWMSDHFVDFTKGLDIGLQGNNQLIKDMDHLGEQTVMEDNYDVVRRSSGKEAVGFKGSDKLSVNLWPPYHVAMLIAEHRAKVYEKALADLSEAKLQLIALQELQSGGNADLMVERKIQRIQRDIETLNKKILTMEEAIK